MKNFVRLNKNEMKMIVGGTDDRIVAGSDDCTSECSSNADCPTGKTCAAYRTSCPTPLVGICQ